MKVTRVIFLIQTPLSKRDYERFGIDIFIKSGFDVIVWDFTRLMYPNQFMKIADVDLIEYENIITFMNNGEAISEIGMESKGTFFINLLPYNHFVLNVLNEIYKREFLYSIAILNIPMPLPHLGASLISRVKSITPKKIFNYLLRSWHYSKVHQPPFCVLGGRKNLPVAKARGVGARTKLIWTHSFDYDIAIKNRNGESILKTDTVVFLDTFAPFHPDYILTGRKHVDPDKYYSTINRFFDDYEEKFKLEIVIAAHPRSNYNEREPLYGGREVIRNKTVELVRDAKCVLMHYSTAINFCILYKKPMTFVTMDCLEGHLINGRTKSVSSYFNKTLYNLNESLEVDFEKEQIVNDELYSKYKDEYIKTNGSEELPSWQIVSNIVKSLDTSND